MRRGCLNRAVASGVALLAGLAIGCGGPAPILECEARDGTTPLCGFQNPEDLAVAPDGEWLVVSASPRGAARGNLLGFRPSDGARRDLWTGDAEPADPSVAACPGPPALDTSLPHGLDITADARSLLLVSHGDRGAPEEFRSIGHPPEDVARGILRGIECNKPRVIVGVEAYFTDWLKRSCRSAPTSYSRTA